MKAQNNTQLKNAESMAGTGFMPSLSEALVKYKALGFTAHLVPNMDHFSCDSDSVRIYPREINVEAMLRFENASDPDDQSIMFVLSAPTKNIRGIYVDSYGIYHDDLSQGMLQALMGQRTKQYR